VATSFSSRRRLDHLRRLTSGRYQSSSWRSAGAEAVANHPPSRPAYRTSADIEARTKLPLILTHGDRWLPICRQNG